MIIVTTVFLDKVTASEAHPEGFAAYKVKMALASISMVREYGNPPEDVENEALPAAQFLLKTFGNNLFVVSAPSGIHTVTDTTFEELVGMAEHENTRCLEAHLRMVKAMERSGDGGPCA